MALTPVARAAINRRNSQASTGPRSESGKSRASLNAYKHGLRAEKFALPPEDREELEQLTDEWLDYYRPESPGRRALLDRAVMATLQLRRNARFQAEELSKQVRSADERFEREQDEQVEALKARLVEDPATAVRELRRSAAGCRWLIGQWNDLKSHLDEDGCWYADTHRDQMLRLLGKRPEDRKDEDVYWLCLINLAAWSGAKEQGLAWYLDPRNAPDTLHRLLARGCPGAAHGTSELNEMVAEELAVLEAREAYLRVTIEVPDREGAVGRAMILEGEAGARWLRYERMHDSAFHRAYKALLKREEGSDPEHSSSPPDQAVTSGPPVPNEAIDAGMTAPVEAKAAGLVAPDQARRAAPAEAGTEGLAAPNEANLVARPLTIGGPVAPRVPSSEPVSVSAVAARIEDKPGHPKRSHPGGGPQLGEAAAPNEANLAGRPAPTRVSPHEGAGGRQLWDGPGTTTAAPSGRPAVVMDREFLERTYGPRRGGPDRSPTESARTREVLGPVVPP